MPHRVPPDGSDDQRTPEPRTGRATLAMGACVIMVVVDRDELAGCLRVWRDRLTPAEAGLPAGGARRAPGLRREEVARLAGLSVDYLSRLEQGRASNPSASVLAPLARALRLTDEERDHLFRVAGQAPPGAGQMSRHLTPGVQRVLDRLTDVPVMVIDASWQIITANALWVALVGDAWDASGRGGNVVWRIFTGAPSRFVRTPQEHAGLEAEAVADLHQALGRHPADDRLRGLVDDLRRTSTRFAELWDARPVARRAAARKTIDHPEVGRLTLDCDELTVGGSDLRLIVYTAPPGSSEARSLAQLSAVGVQSFAAG